MTRTEHLNAPDRRIVQANTDSLERAIQTMNEARSDMRELRREITVLAERRASGNRTGG